MAAYAYVCTLCHHLASRHYLKAGSRFLQGPFVCSHESCACEIDQTTPLTGINRDGFNRNFAPYLDEYQEAH